MLSTLTQSLRLLPLIVLAASASACRDPLPCPDCDEQAEGEAEEGPPPPDLPCGGADLMTDNLNCGSCGNVCNVWWEGTDWEAGICVDGECGPYWKTCLGVLGGGDTCDELCGGTGRTCAANGCSGLTAMLFDVGIDGYCGPSFEEGPDATMKGPCDEDIPWMTPIGFSRGVMCCCSPNL